MIPTSRPTRFAMLSVVLGLALAASSPPACAGTCEPPTITSMTPASVPAAGGILLTINGSNFTAYGSPKVTIGLRDVPVILASNVRLVVLAPPQDDDAQPAVRIRAGKFKPAKMPLDRIAYAPPLVDAAPPALVSRGGGTRLTITGSNFRCSAPGAYLENPATGGTCPAHVVSASDTSIVVETEDCDDADPDRVLHVTLAREGIVHRDLAARNILLSGSRVASVTPASVPACGGSTITVVGSDFDDGSGLAPRAQVCVDGRCADVRVTSYTNTQLVGVAPPAPVVPSNVAGKVVVTTSAGTGSSGTLAYDSTPIIRGSRSSSLPASGGVPLTIRGDNFGPGTLVRYDDGIGAPVDVAPTSLGGGQIVSAAVSSVGVQMQVSLVQDGQASEPITLPVLPPPAITNVSGGAGGLFGGDLVTITGQNFGPVSPGGHDVLVIFDQNGVRAPAGPVRWTAPEVLVVRAPVMQAGSAGVIVSVNGVETVGPSAITYVSNNDLGAPRVSFRNPTSAAPGGGTVITLIGSDFGTSGTLVRFGSQLVAPLQLQNNALTFVSPPFDAGEEQAAVEVVAANQKASNPLYQDKRGPANNPLAGSERSSWAGGTPLTITGSDFEASARVEVSTGAGDVFRIVPSSVSPSQITFVTPELPGGSSASVRVVDGSLGGASVPLPYSGPIVSGISSTTMSQAGGTVLTITGSGFGAVAGKGFFEKGDKPTQDSWSDHVIVVTTSPRAPGCPAQRPFRIQTAAGDVSNATTIAFVEPVVDGPDTPATSALGGIPLTIRGSDFGPNAHLVWADGLPGPDITITDRCATSFAVLLGAGSPGSRLLSLDPESQGAPAPFALDLLAPPAATVVSPAIGPISGGNVVTVTGANFGPQGTRRNVHFAGADDCPFDVLDESSTLLVCQLPPGSSPGLRDLVIEVEGVADTLMDAYEYSTTVSVDGVPSASLALALAPLRTPFAGELTLRMSLPQAGHWQLRLYDARGALVQRLEGDAPAGVIDVRWNGRSNEGRAAAPGVYFARLVTAQGTRDARVVKLQ